MDLRSSSVVWSPLPPSAELIASARRSQSLDLVLVFVYGSSGRPAHVVGSTQVLLLSDPQDFLDRGPLDELLDVLLKLEAVRRGDRVQVV